MKRVLDKSLNDHALASRRIAGLSLSESLYPPGLRQPRHTHEFASFSFVLTGNYVENYECRAQARPASTLVFRPPQQAHSVQYEGEGVRILSVKFDFERFERIRRHCAVLDSPAAVRTEAMVWLCRRLHGEFRRADALSDLAIEALILEILVEASRNGGTGSNSKSEINEAKSVPRWLSRAKEFLETHFAESLTLEQIARTGGGGVHPVYLARAFRENFGCTIGEYIRSLRLDFACRQIAASQTPLSEIALAAGFADQSHLTKTFKIRYGLTPSEYRKVSRHP